MSALTVLFGFHVVEAYMFDRAHDNIALIIAIIAGWWFAVFFLRAVRLFSFFTEMIRRVIIGDLRSEEEHSKPPTSNNRYYQSNVVVGYAHLCHEEIHKQTNTKYKKKTYISYVRHV
jgi:uncharacterized membrane protein YraQ (UPF0718 family)